MANIFVAAAATWNGKALKKGQKDISAFDKQTQKLGRTFSRVFATTTLVAFSKKAINAFAADEKAAKSLAVQLENTGNAFRVNEVESYIAGLQSLYGVLDDQLRPAFQTLLNATGSVTLSQQALETALNVSAGTGKDLATVVAAIAKGASGTTTSIARLGTGLDKATIATGDMNKIMAALDAKFAGQAQARLSTYAGKMDLLKVAAADATEIIGKGLIDAISAIGKDNSIDQAADSMNNFAVAIANTTKGMGELIGQVKRIVDTDVGKFLLGLTALLTLGKKQLVLGAAGLIAYDIGKSQKSSASTMGGYSGIPLQKAENKAIKDAVTYRKQENALLKAKTAVDQLRDKFDLERIGLAAALNAATDEETKLRIKAQIAILDNNEALAKKLLAEMEAAEAAKKLAAALGTVGDATIEYFKKLAESLVGTMAYFNMSMQQILAERLKESGKTSLGGGMTGGGFTPLTAGYFQNLGSQLQGSSAYAGMSAGEISLERARESGNRSLDVNLVVSAPSGNAFAQLVAESIQVAGRDGYSTAPNGGLP
jgi:hypothetical protein